MSDELTISEAGLALIRRFEGFSATPYLCPAGKPTIGYGHVIGETEHFDLLTPEQAANILQKECDRLGAALSALIFVQLQQYQIDALISLVYNIGLGAFKNSTLRQYVNSRQWDKAGQEFLRWRYAGGKELPGLLARRQAESALFSGKNAP